MLVRTFLVTAALILSAAVSAHAAPLTPADRAWIEQCIAARKAGSDKPSALRIYCRCMQEVVEDNQPFGITELERTYPPAHRQCWRKAGLKPG